MFEDLGISCEIVFDNEERSYQSGQVVNAQINLTFNEATKCRCIYAKFIGEAVVKWTKRRHRKRRHGGTEEVAQDYLGREDYFSINRDIIRSDDGSEMKLEAKRFTRSITCTLPHNLPSSFSGQYGAVRYWLKVYIDAGRIDEITETEFKVYTPLDLNQLPHLRQSKTLDMSKDFCCWIWRNGPLSLSATIPYTGFMPNQHVTITIDCENGSSVDLQACKVYIKQITTFNCAEPKREMRTEEVQICETKLDGVPKHTTKRVHGVLTIPNLKSTNLTRCRIIEVKYVLKMKGVTSRANSSLFKELPIVIGEIPFSNFNYDEANRRDSARSATVTEVGHELQEESEHNEKNGGPPPSYSEVVNTNSRVDIGWNSNMSS